MIISFTGETTQVNPKESTIYHSFISGLRLVITATDRGTPRLAGSATLTVIIIDLNDNSPMIPLPRQIHVPEGKSTWQTLVAVIDTAEPRPWLLIQ